MKYIFYLLLLTLGQFLYSKELIKNGSFEDGLKHWIVKGKATINNTEAAFGKNSLQITLDKPVWQRVFQTINIQPSTEYILEYYVKCKDVVPKAGAKFAGAASQVLAKKYFPSIGSAGPWKLDKDNTSWKKVSYKFKTTKDDKTITIQFLLSNASGTVWFDNISLKQNKKSISSPITINLYPIKFLGNTSYKIAQNITGTIYLSAQSKLKLAKSDKIEMILDVPNFVKVTGAAPKFAMQMGTKENPRRINKAYQVKEIGKIKRNNKELKRYKITLGDDFKKYFAASWYTHYIFLKAEANSVNKKDYFYCYMQAGNKKSPETKGIIEIIPAIERKNPPCRYFEFTMAKIPFLSTIDILEGQEENRAFWSSMSQKRYTWVRPCDAPVKGFEPIITVGNNFWTVIDAAQPDLKALKKVLPVNTSDKGTKRPGFAVWSKLDKEQKRIENMYKTGAKEIKRLYPETKNVTWDFEPHPYGFDQGGRERFAKAMKLSYTPTIEEINSKYRNAWFNYMVKLHAQYINRFVKIFKENAPGINFNLCSDNLYAGENTISAWCGVDVRLSDDVVDGHMHMPYYAGKKFFDDCQFNINNLKKPFFPLIDPAEALYSFYKQYDANKIKQNIIAVASLGGKGIGFWPSDAFSADYTKAISQAYDIVYDAEIFYTKGRRCDNDFTFTPVNAITKTVVNNNKKVTLCFPDFMSSFRKTVHKYNNKVLFTLFNYHDTEEAIIKIVGMGKEKFVAIPANGVKVIKLDSKQEDSVLRKIANFNAKSSSLKLPELKANNMSLEWAAKDNGAPYFLMKNQSTTIGVDVLKEGNIISFKSENGSEFISNGFLGKIMFYDNLQQEVSAKIDSMKITKEGPQLTLKGIVGPYAGASPIPNPLLEMEVYRKYTLTKNTLKIEFTFFNPTNKNMTFGFRLNNYPYPGKRFDAKNIVSSLTSNGKTVKITSNQNLFTINGKPTLFTKKVPAVWNHSPITTQAKQGTMLDAMSIIADTKFVGVTSWFDIYNHTIELLTNNVTIQPKEKITFICDIKVVSK